MSSPIPHISFPSMRYLALDCVLRLCRCRVSRLLPVKNARRLYRNRLLKKESIFFLVRLGLRFHNPQRNTAPTAFHQLSSASIFGFQALASRTSPVIRASRGRIDRQPCPRFPSRFASIFHSALPVLHRFLFFRSFASALRKSTSPFRSIASQYLPHKHTPGHISHVILISRSSLPSNLASRLVYSSVAV